MKKMKKWLLAMMATALLFTLTACGLNLNTETLSKDGQVYVAGKQIWKFNKNGTLDIYNKKDGSKELGEKMSCKYNVKEDKKGYTLEVIQQYNDQSSDYKLVFDITTSIYIEKSGQNNREFTGKIKSVKASNIQIESSIEGLTETLQQHYSKENLEKEAKKMIGKSVTFKAEKAEYLTEKPKYKK